MTTPKLDRRDILKASAASVAAAGFVDGLLDSNSAWAQSNKPLRVRTNRAILSTDPVT
ncbi:MAG: twin-arginine translocation signal domain-containing protein [Alphaproteobacteria bacterium]